MEFFLATLNIDKALNTNKPTDTNDLNELFDLLQYTDETDRIEAKEASQGLGKSFLETVSALSNEPGLGGGIFF